MPEPSSSAPPPESKNEPRKPKKAKAKPPPPPPQEAGLLTRWSTWSVLGVVLLGSVVVWRLSGSSYKSDVRTICNAERGSGLTFAKDSPKITQWIRDSLDTPEGNTFFSSLTDAKLIERGKRLQSEADAVSLPACPTVSAYERLTAEGEYRSDVQHLCSARTFPKLAEEDDDGRLAEIEDWVTKVAKSPRTKELVERLRSAPPAGRAKLMRETGLDLDVFTCENAKTLESPQAPPKASALSVRLRSPPQVNGPLKEADFAKALAEVTPAMTQCYKKGLEKKPDLAGELPLKVQVDAEGKVIRAAPADAKLDDSATLACIVDAVKSATLPKNPGPLVSVLLPLELTPGSQPHP